MTTESTTFTRRETFLYAFKGTLAAALIVPASAIASEPSPVAEPEFVPENDYPFFGYEPASQS